MNKIIPHPTQAKCSECGSVTYQDTYLHTAKDDPLRKRDNAICIKCGSISWNFWPTYSPKTIQRVSTPVDKPYLNMVLDSVKKLKIKEILKNEEL